MLNTPEQPLVRSDRTLGLRLGSSMGAQLASLARRTGRTKSDIARDAVREYLDRHDDDAEFRRQVAALNDGYTAEDRAWRGAASDAWLRALDEEDGGYDWGPDGPPA